MSAPPVDYGPEIEAALQATQARLAAMPDPRKVPAPRAGDPKKAAGTAERLDTGTPDTGPPVRGRAARWTALRVLDGDPEIRAAIAGRPGGKSILTDRDELDERIQAERGLDLSLLLAERRFQRAQRIAARVVARGGSSRGRLGARIDRVVTHRVFGPIVLFTVMWVVFRIVTNVSAPFVEWIGTTLTGTIGPWIASALGAIGLGGGWVERLAVDGILGGVGAMLAFVPVIVVLYMVLGVLEDTGYLARAAYVTDRAMGLAGLPGKSVLPLVVGFGCNVPALMATRVLDRPKDRLLTGLLVPFVSCSARLPIYVLLASALFPGQEGAVVFALYLTSIAFVFMIGILLRHTLMRGTERAPFVLELPPYRRPSWPTVWTQTRQRSGAFLRKAGSVILIAAVLVWVLLAIPVRGHAPFGDVPQPDSLFGVAAGSATAVFRPAGFGAPQLSGALASGFVAKEVVVSTMGQTVGGDDKGDTHAAGPDAAGPGIAAGLADAGLGLLHAAGDAVLAVPGIVGIRLGDSTPQADQRTETGLQRLLDESSGGHPQLAAFAFMVFVLLYVPCLATVVTFGREFGKRWALFSVGLSMVVAWIAAVGVFQIGRALAAI